MLQSGTAAPARSRLRRVIVVGFRMVIDSSVDIQAMKFEAFFLARRLSDAGVLSSTCRSSPRCCEVMRLLLRVFLDDGYSHPLICSSTAVAWVPHRSCSLGIAPPS